MTPATGTALLLLVAFVLPGFVAVTVKERIHEIPREVPPFDRLLLSLYYSALVYAVPAAVVLIGGWSAAELDDFATGEHGVRGPLGVAVLLLVVLPVAVAYAGQRWTGSERREAVLERLNINPSHAVPSAWDFMFRDAEQAIVRATRRDGAVVTGYYGPSSQSGFASRGDLFLEEQWQPIDAEHTAFEPVASSVGVWIAADDLVTVELYPVSREQQTNIARKRAARHRRARSEGAGAAE